MPFSSRILLDVILELNDTAPPSLISMVIALTVPDVLSPIILKSPLVTVDLSSKSLPFLVKRPNSVPPSESFMSAPSASSVISPATSIVKSPLDKSISVPSIVMLSTVIPPSTSKTPLLFIVAFVEPSTLNCIAELDTAPSSSTPILKLAPLV